MSTLPTDTQSDPDEINLLDLLQVVAENLRLLVLGPLAVGLIALGITFMIRPIFTATTVFLPPQQQQSAAAGLLQSLGVLGGLAGAATGVKNPNDQYVSFLKSVYIEDRIIGRFKLKERYEADLQMEARKTLEENVRINSGKDGLITVDVDDKDASIAAKMANAHVEELNNLMQRMAVTEAQQRRAFFEIQLLSTKDKLTKAEIALRASGVNSSALKSNPENAVAVVARVQAEIAAQEVKLSSMRTYLAESAPAFKVALSELAALRSQFNKLEKTNDTPSATDSDYVSRFRDFKYYETLFELFAKQFEIAKVDESKEGAVIQVLDVAEPPEKKSKPKRALIAILATLVSAILLLLFVFSRHGFRRLAADPDGLDRLEKLGRSIRGKK
jgi:tyrosine-protein kinase Etk/Wzc